MGIRASFSVFYSHLVEVFSWGRGEAAVAQSISFVMYMAFVPIIGTLVDRFDPRKVVVLGVIICGIGLILCAFIKNLWTLYIYYGIIAGTGICFISIVTYSAILSRWFERKRGFASGIATSGMGVGTFLLVLFAERMIQIFGWREAFIILGIITLGVLLPTNGLFLRSKPQEMGLEVDGLSCSLSLDDIRKNDYRFWDALRTRKFWFLVCFASFALMGIQIILVHNVRFLVDKGIDVKIASVAFAVVGIISSLFRIIWGWLSDRIGREWSYSIGAICLALSALWLIFVYPENDLPLLPFCFVFWDRMGSHCSFFYGCGSRFV
uniref:MFS transporter n=1 Tax=candidate division WOR-3 bacterium TaxID=2052148 RepID=A0A7C2NZR9_UNCW3